MTSITKQIVEMLDMLPESEQQLACELLKRLVLAWDPDFSKMTPSELERLQQVKAELEESGTINHQFIEWN
jgi:hypothetical protein